MQCRRVLKKRMEDGLQDIEEQCLPGGKILYGQYSRAATTNIIMENVDRNIRAHLMFVEHTRR